MQNPEVTPSQPLSPLVTDPVGTPIFTVQLLGFTPRERTLFGSVFNLSRGRPVRYVEFDPVLHPHADFYIVDTDASDAFAVFRRADPQTYGGALFVGEAQGEANAPVVKRPVRWAEVLMRLDELPRPVHSAQVAALIAAGLVELEQIPGEVLATPDETTESGSTPAATVPTPTIVRVQAENELEISSLPNWYDRDEVITFHTDPAVLVIDPDIAARRYMAAKFIDLKYRVDYAENGEQALEMINSRRYNAVFLETALPGVDGYEICKAIKGRPDRRRIAVIFVSSRTSTLDRVKGAMAGCDAFLAKPIDQDKLVAALDKFLPNWRLQLPIV